MASPPNGTARLKSRFGVPAKRHYSSKKALCQTALAPRKRIRPAGSTRTLDYRSERFSLFRAGRRNTDLLGRRGSRSFVQVGETPTCLLNPHNPTLKPVWRPRQTALHQPHPYTLRVLSALEKCRTQALGGHVDGCDSCGFIRVSYNSCRNRHCPKCQTTNRESWILARMQDLLPVPYFHMVFTLPELENPLLLLLLCRTKLTPFNFQKCS